ncbi:hypothetical protein N7465_000985 [Penicillium sp. CMV-2018d]|nr:hypothetical protein N7465_000985 [Penicillium sp. CMV-2018d]
MSALIDTREEWNKPWDSYLGRRRKPLEKDEERIPKISQEAIPTLIRAILGCFKLTFEHMKALPKVDHSSSLPGVSIATFMEDQKQLIRGFRYLING